MVECIPYKVFLNLIKPMLAVTFIDETYDAFEMEACVVYADS